MAHLRTRTVLRGLVALALALAMSGCDLVVMFPSGDVAAQQRNLVVASTGLMLLIIVPVMALTLFFAWHYRATNREAAYDPGWHHSAQLEVIIWAVPLIIVVALGALTWISTHTLDPYRGLSRLGPKQPLPQDEKPLVIEAVALDWKWLFFYPEQGIATVNELAAPVNRPIQFKITASTVMNAFYVPALAGMIYAMPGMQTQLHAVINKEGVYKGLSSHYSGAGFSHMTFKFHGLTNDAFAQWIDKAKTQGSELSRDGYLDLERPSESVPVGYYARVADGLFDAILNMCVVPGKMCRSEMMQRDAKGSAGPESRGNLEKLQYDNRFLKEGLEPPGATAPATGRAPRSEAPRSDTHEGHTMPDMQRGTGMPADQK